MQCDNSKQVARCCYEVARSFQVEQTEAPPWSHVALLLGTSAVESGFMRGVDGRSGLGLWKIQAQTGHFAFDLLSYMWVSKYVFKNKKAPWELFSSAWLGIRSVPYFKPTLREIRYLLVHDDMFACTMCYWLYFEHMPKLRQNLPEIADFWYAYYPTILTQLRPSAFLDAWSDKECQSLMYGLGYQ